MQSESVQAALGAFNTWLATGNITVPAGVASLKKVIIGVAPDPGVGAATIHLLPVFRLLGSGLLEQNPHQYVAQGCDSAHIAAGLVCNNPEPALMIYDVDIPVQTGGVIEVQHMNITEAFPGIARCELVFGAEASAGGNNMSDYVTAVAPAAAAAWLAVGTLTVPQLGEGKSPKRIKRIDCGIVPDGVAAITTSLMVSTRYRLTGSGVAEGGNHHILGNGQAQSCVGAGEGMVDRCIVTHHTDIPVNAGGAILVEHINDGDIQPGDSVFCVQYA